MDNISEFLRSGFLVDERAGFTGSFLIDFLIRLASQTREVRRVDP
jgi:hypothetical protein